MMKNKVIVKQQAEVRSKNYGVYVNGHLVEGGFFSRGAAEQCADAWRSELAADELAAEEMAAERFLSSMER